MDDAALANATIFITLSATSLEGDKGEPIFYVEPLHIDPSREALFIIRNGRGRLAEQLTLGESHECTNEILTNMCLPSAFIQSGVWKAEIIAKVPDGTCLFAFTIVQWLEGHKDWKERMPSENPYRNGASLRDGARAEKEKEKEKMQ